MGRLEVRNIPDELLKRLDEIAESKGMSRSELVIVSLQIYADCQDKKLHKMLPAIVESEVKEELRRFEYRLSDTLTILLKSALNLEKTTEKLNYHLFPELKNLDIDSMSIEQILAIINAENADKPDDFDEDFTVENDDIIMDSDIDF